MVVTVRQRFLLIAAAGLTPIALSYGAVPGKSLSYLFGVTVDGANLTHIFRAVMGLYLALAAFWVFGAFRDDLTVPALWSLVVFMFGLAGGRAISLFLDGMPHWLLFGYLLIELAFGVVGLRLLEASARLAFWTAESCRRRLPAAVLGGAPFVSTIPGTNATL